MTGSGFYGGYEYLGGKNKNTGFLRFLTIFLPILMIAVFAGGIIMGYLSYANSVEKPKPVDAVSSSEKISDEENAQLLRVVNTANPLDKSFVPQLAQCGSVQVSPLALTALENMLEAAQKDGVSLVAKTGYVDFDSQQRLYEEKKQSLINSKGYTQIKAESVTKKTVPKGGESEAQTGLLVVFGTSDETAKSFRDSKAFLWLQKNCVNYGFVQRYTADAEEYTSMNADYTAFRYVGEQNARKMRSYNMCLEQYVNHVAAE